MTDIDGLCRLNMALSRELAMVNTSLALYLISSPESSSLPAARPLLGRVRALLTSHEVIGTWSG